jgi:hypothetical protein
MAAMDDPRTVLGVGPDATAAELRRARRRLAKELHPDLHDERTRGGAERRMALVNRAFDLLREGAETTATPGAAGAAAPVPPIDAFAIEALPVDAFEATLLAAVELGDVVRAEEPYLLAVLLDHPGPCQCLLELAPDAGGTTVTIEVAPRHYGTCPAVEEVRDAFVAEIGRQISS